MCPLAIRVSGPKVKMEAGVKPAPKPSLDRWESVCKISTRLVQGLGFPLALHIPTDRQTNLHAHMSQVVIRYLPYELDRHTGPGLAEPDPRALMVTKRSWLG